jgi:UDP-N-acetylmuramoyl-tripeptide--D-alanyl-D-alanine ligase
MIASTLGSLEDLTGFAGGELHARVAEQARGPRAGITGVSIDTRTLETGDLFVPLPGAQFDGHDFIAEAFRRGAAATLCSRERFEALAPMLSGPAVVVEDVTRALQLLAQRHRQRWTGTLIGITGSSGKTTTKDLVAAAFATRSPTLKTEGNLNNHWGVPLTLLRLRPEHRAAVVEMGTNHPGEIATLARLAAPDAGVITNTGNAHIEYFGSVDAVAREKASLAESLEPHSVLVAGADSPELMRALEGARCRVVTFGFGAGAMLAPRAIEDLGPEGLRFDVDGFPPVRLALAGRHQVLNALVALALVREYGLDRAAVARALAGYRAPHGRMEVRNLGGATVLVDCYNANPESTRAALETLAAWPAAERRIAILGDMLELGARAPEFHRAAGSAVRSAELWAVGRHAADYAAGAREAGAAARLFENKAAVVEALREALEPGTVILLKASRGAALEQVLQSVQGRGD